MRWRKVAASIRRTSRSFSRERDKLQPYGRALLALTLSLVKMDQRALGSRERRSNAPHAVDRMTAYWQTKRGERLDFLNQDQTEGTALSLKALTRIKPDSSLLPLAARWLVSDRSKRLLLELNQRHRVRDLRTD